MPIRAAPPGSSASRVPIPSGAKRVAPPGWKPGRATKKKGGPSVGGFLGNIGSGLKDLAVGSAVGTVELGRGLYEARVSGENERLKRIGKGVAEDYSRRFGPLASGDFGEFAHQLYEDPVAFGLDAFAVASLGAGAAVRGASVARAGTVRGAAHAVRHGPKTELRYAKLPESEAKVLLGTYSRAASTRQVQKFLDRIRHQFPDAPIMGRSLYRKVGFQQGRLAEIEERLGRAQVGELQAVAGGRKLTAPQHRALRVVGEGVPLDARIARHRADLANAKDARQARKLRGEIRLLEKTRKYLDESGTALKDPKLQEVYALVQQSAKRREDILAAVDELAPERARARIQQPGRVLAGAEYERIPAVTRRGEQTRLYPNVTTEQAGRLIASNLGGQLVRIGSGGAEILLPARAGERARKGLRGEEGFSEGEVFFTYAEKKRSTSFARLGASRTIRHPRQPGTRQEFTGAAITQGRIPRQEAALAAEAELEAWRFSTILRNRDRLIEMAKPMPTKPTDIAIVLDDLRGKRLPEEVRAFLDKSASGQILPAEELTALARIGEGLREQIFPGKWNELQRLAEYRGAAAQPIPGVVWIDKRLLGGLHSPNPLVGFSQNAAAKAGLSTIDAINNAQKAALLYVLPLKYITPNLISQTAFALIQQGFAAPHNLASAARLNAKLGKKATATIDAGMGEGFAASIAGSTTGPLTKLNNWAARNYGKVIDLPFRRAAFLHEAKRAGFKSPEEINRLLFDDSLRDRRLATFLDANGEIIDYARMGRSERNIVRRVIFFYPWVKGATVYGARFLGEHPGKAWVLDQLGKVGTEIQAEALGDQLPAYAEALAPIGSSGGMPTTVNLAAVSPFTTPYQILRGLAGDQRSSYALGSQFSPAIAAGIMATGFTPPGGYGAGPGAAGRELYEGTPEFYYGRRILEGSPERAVYPTTLAQNIAALIFGTGVTPRRTNPQRLAEEARRGR